MSKRSNSGSNSNASKRFKGGDGSRKKNYFTSGSGRFIGPGIFLTTVRNKELKAADELTAVLNDLADELYPNVVLSSESAVHTVRRAQPGDEENAANPKSEEAAGPAATAAAPVVRPANPVPAKDDVEAQIAAELAELKGKRGTQTSNGEPKSRKRFEVVDVGTECLRYIQVTPPMDPFILVRAYLEQVERTGEARSRFVQRVTPIAGTCHAHIDDVKALAELILPRWFAKGDEASDKESDKPLHEPRKNLSFRVEPRIRLSSTITRETVIPVLAAAVPEGAGHHANLKTPDVTIFFESHKGIGALGVLEDYERFKKYNPQQIAEGVKKARPANEPSRVGEAQSSEAKPAAVSASLPATTDDAKVEPVAETSERKDA